MKKNFGYVFLAAALVCCKPGKDEGFRVFPAETDLEQLNSTEFVLTQKNIIPDEKNVIYCPSFLFAWDEVRNNFREPISLKQIFSEDLLLINQDTTFRNSLSKDEYKTSVEFRDGSIMASAFFHQSLPFPKKFQLKDTLFFRGWPVRAFGIEEFDSGLAENVKVLYYKNDNNFVISLVPRKPDHEIILCRSIFTYTCMADLVKGTDSLIQLGKNDKIKYPALYSFTAKDKLLVPVLSFNISKRYNTLEGQNFDVGKHNYIIRKAFQRTAFILNEQGAEIESAAEVAVDSTAAPLKDTTLPKNLVFDRPFFMMLRKRSSPNPYFTVMVKSTEVMVAPEKKSNQIVIRPN